MLSAHGQNTNPNPNMENKKRSIQWVRFYGMPGIGKSLYIHGMQPKLANKRIFVLGEHLLNADTLKLDYSRPGRMCFFTLWQLATQYENELKVLRDMLTRDKSGKDWVVIEHTSLEMIQWMASSHIDHNYLPKIVVKSVNELCDKILCERQEVLNTLNVKEEKRVHFEGPENLAELKKSWYNVYSSNSISTQQYWDTINRQVQNYLRTSMSSMRSQLHAIVPYKKNCINPNGLFQALWGSDEDEEADE